MKKQGLAVTVMTSALLLAGQAAFAQMQSQPDQPSTSNSTSMMSPQTHAATAQPTSNSPMPPAIATTSAPSKTMAAPVPGQNSFTEMQAKSRLHKFGYTHVAGLQLDPYHVWRGQAMKGGKTVSVSLDYQGNVTAQPTP